MSITESERALFALYVSTGSVKEAAVSLGISEQAAKSRLRRLYRRNGVSSGVQMARLLYTAPPVSSHARNDARESPPSR